MSTLATLAEVRSRLELPVNVERDAVIEAFLLAAEERILDLTGFLTTDDPYFAPVQKVDILANVQAGMSRQLKFRPVLSATLETRMLGDTTFSAADSDIRDAGNGRVMLLGSNFLSNSVDIITGYPLGARPPWARWQEPIWPTVRCTYTVDPLGSDTNPVPAALNRAVVEWAAAIMSQRPGSGPLQSYSAEKISETFTHNLKKSGLPPIIDLLIARYVRGYASIV